MPLHLDETQRIGIILSVLGIFFAFLGVIFLFDKGLLTIGNLLFIGGVGLILGREGTVNLFFQKRSLRGSISFFIGIILVLMGWTFIGIIAEAYGFFYIFGSFFPIALAFLRKIPVLGTILSIPGLRQLIDRTANMGRSSQV